MTTIAPGMTFTHWAFLDPDWRPAPGQKYRDAPKATMRITRVTATLVYYSYATGGGKWVTDRAHLLAHLSKGEPTP